jgi:cyclopropane fatty-acyl-phospholipid synthase-like methyltransferase
MVREDTRMPVPPELFDEDYLYFYDEVLSAERADADAEVVARLLRLEPGARVLDVPCGTGRIAGRLAARGCEVVSRLEFTLEQVPAHELEARLARAGFQSVRLFGAGGGEYLPDGPRLVAVAVR